MKKVRFLRATIKAEFVVVDSDTLNVTAMETAPLVVSADQWAEFVGSGFAASIEGLQAQVDEATAAEQDPPQSGDTLGPVRYDQAPPGVTPD